MSIAGISGRNILLVIFVAATALSSAAAVSVTANYYQFYPSLSRIELRLNNLQIKDIMIYREINASFSILDPTDYKGITITMFRGSYELDDQNNITLSQPQGLPVPLGFVTQPLNKNIPVTVVDAFNATNVQATKIQVLFVIQLGFSTFLDQFGPITATYACLGSSGPGSCEQVAVSVQGSGNPFGGRGGGV